MGASLAGSRACGFERTRSNTLSACGFERTSGNALCAFMPIYSGWA